MRLTEERIQNLLDRWPVARLATLRPDGSPHQVPIVFARSGERLVSPVDGKPKTGGELARVPQIERSPAVSLLLDEYAEDWSRLWWIQIDAVGRIVRGVGPAEEELVQALEAKYPQYGAVPVLREPATLLVFEVRQIRSWCASDTAGAPA